MCTCLQGSELVFVLAASNLPWELDMALLRRLEKKVFVPLPDVKARESMLKCNLQSRTLQTSQVHHSIIFGYNEFDSNECSLMMKTYIVPSFASSFWMLQFSDVMK